MERSIILFDSKCSICCQIKEIISILDKNSLIKFVSLYEFNFDQRNDGLNFWDARKTIHLITPRNEVLKGDDVIHYLLELSPIFKTLPILHQNFLSSRAIKSGYEMLNAIRLNRMKNCDTCEA